MKHIVFTALAAIAPFCAWAQSGTYQRKDKDATELMELRSNGSFSYTYQTGFAKSFTEGSWKLEGKTIVFRSNKQIALKADETQNPKSKSLQVQISAPSARKGPRTIEKVYINEQLVCSRDESKALAYLEKYNEIMTVGSPAQKDSLKTAFAPKYYNCSDYNGTVDSVVIFFDKKKAIYKPTDKTANELNIKVILDDDSLYRYFEDEKWQWVDKKILAPPTGEPFKKGKK